MNCQQNNHNMMTSSNGNIFCATGPLCGEFPAQRPVTRRFDVFFDLRPKTRLSKQWWGWWLRRHRAHYDVIVMSCAWIRGFYYICKRVSIVPFKFCGYHEKFLMIYTTHKMFMNTSSSAESTSNWKANFSRTKFRRLFKFWMISYQMDL